MTLQVNLHVEEGNDIVYALVATDANGAIINLTGYTARVVVKASQQSTDASGTTYASGGANLTIATGVLGVCSFKLPHTATGTPGTQWYRFDVIDGSGNVYTSQFGVLTVRAA